MRIPTDSMFQQQLSLMSEQFQRVARLYQQEAYGKKLIDNSDDPVLASQISLTNDFLTDLRSYGQNIITSRNRTSLFESSIGDAGNTVDQIKQIIQSAGSIKTDSERAAMANQLKGYLNVLLNDANTRDSNGDYIYGGFNVGVQPYSSQNGTYVYQGDYNTSAINIGPNSSVLYNESGYRVFGNIPTGNGTFTVTGTAGNTGAAYSTPGSVTNSSNYIADTYTITFVTNSDGKLAYQVVGAVSGQVIPPPPATTPANAPDYVPDSDVTFNGMTLHFYGNPDVGDTFTVAPSQKENVFNDLQGLIDLLNTPIGSDPVKTAKFNQALSQYSATFSQVFDQFVNYKSEVGTRMQVILNQDTLNKNMITNEKDIYSKLSDADPVAIGTDLSQQLFYMQATQDCYLKIQATMMQLLQMK